MSVNPRRRPRTEADCERARAQGQTEGLTLAMEIFFTVLFDKHGASKEDLRVFWDEVNDLSDSVARGYVSAADLRNVLRREYDIEV